MASTWVVRAGKSGAFVDRFLDGGYVAIDFQASDLGDLGRSPSKDDIARRMTRLMPTAKPGTIQGYASQVYRFAMDVQKGDSVITGDPSRRLYFLGTITSDLRFEDSEHRRSVRWAFRIARDQLSLPSLNSLGAIQTLFRLSDEVVADFEAHKRTLDAPEEVGASVPPPPQDVGPSVRILMQEFAEKADSFIEDQLNKLEPYDMQELVAGILRAMGYKTRVSPRGPDRGRDIFASPDGLGLEEPRIFVEVKHQSTSMGAPDIRAFLGGRRAGDRCLYVSTGGFRKDAKYEAERSAVPLTLLDLPALRELLLEHYERLDTQTRQLIPLRRHYWPVGDP